MTEKKAKGTQPFVMCWMQALRDADPLEMSPRAYSAGMTIATYANADGTGAFPSFVTIARGMKHDVDHPDNAGTAKKAVRELEEKGWLTRHTRGRRRYLELHLPLTHDLRWVTQNPPTGSPTTREVGHPRPKTSTRTSPVTSAPFSGGSGSLPRW